MIVGDATPLPMVKIMIGRTCHATNGGANQAATDSQTTPVNISAYPSATVRVGDSLPAIRPDIDAPSMTPLIIGRNNHAKP